MRFSIESTQVVWLGAAMSFMTASAAAQRTASPRPIEGPAPLAAPAGVLVQNDLGGLAFTWQGVAGAIGYQVDAAPGPAGPWTPLVPAPIANTALAHSPVPGVLAYYRIAAVSQLGGPGNPAIVPFIANPPLAETASSVTQSGADLTATWVPVSGALGYVVSVTTDRTTEQRQTFASPTSVTFAGLVPPGTSNRNAKVKVVATFGRGVATATLTSKQGANPTFSATDPNLCWPPAGATPGGPAPVGLTATPVENAVDLAWTPLGQVLGYRIERAPAGTGRWESLGCAGPGQIPVRDQSVTLQPGTGYDYRVTALGPGGLAGASTTTIVTPPPFSPAFSAVVLNSVMNGVAVKVVRLGWPVDISYWITTSYGYRGLAPRGVGPHDVINVPSGTHLFTVVPYYANGVVGRGTTVPVTVP